MRNPYKLLTAASMACLLILGGCGAMSANTPVAVCQRSLAAQQRGDVDELITYFPPEFVDKMRTAGVDMKVILNESVKQAKSKGGIVSTKAEPDKQMGEIAYVKYTIGYGNGTTESGRMPFKMYDGKWKFAADAPK